MKDLIPTASLPTIKTTAIALDNVGFGYSKERQTLTDINLKITSGETVGAIGANGAGKTSLFLTICGILNPSYGTIKLFDRPIQSGQFNPEIGLVFQNPDDQLFCPTVRDDIAFGLENIGLSSREIDKRIEEALALTGVSHLVDRIPHHLSGGEKCMVAIAAVIAMLPQIVLYDEPSANLDLRARRRLIEFLQTSQETAIIASHDLELILEVCDRVILLDRGRIVADGIPSEVMRNKSLMEVNGLEVPHSLTHYHRDS
ncbi:energy-coupling factor ABC transporter ATP-binding protein [Myxosarcina sp. GI1]|uniref:energy-coupling factor ABC transporter ATP-binding protein n=1 Tax=Myxosarcina sp. GI1 TaxID=1541065 RepID=UPI00055FDA83|nr:ABC transporter ATP-binding protein [Myxosarcina sp. GI1]